MENKSPAFQLYPAKAKAGTDHLSDKAFRAYWNILWWMWLHSKSHYTMIDNDTAWKIATGVKNPTALKHVRDEIMQKEHPMLRKCGRNVVSKGLKVEAIKQNKWKRKSKEGGIKSGIARRKEAEVKGG